MVGVQMCVCVCVRLRQSFADDVQEAALGLNLLSFIIIRIINCCSHNLTHLAVCNSCSSCVSVRLTNSRCRQWEADHPPCSTPPPPRSTSNWTKSLKIQAQLCPCRSCGGGGNTTPSIHAAATMCVCVCV